MANAHIIRVAFAVLLITACTLPVTAKAQVFLEEGKVTLAVSGWDRLNKTLLVHNTAGEDMDIRVYWEDFQYKPPYEGSKDFLPAGTAPLSASQWISFSPQQLHIPAYGQAQVNYTIAVPPQIQEGHYGVLFFERSVGRLQEGSGVNVISRVGCLFFIEPKGAPKTASLEDLTISGSGINGNFTNKSKVVLIPRMTYYIMDDAGLVSDRGELKKVYVPPGASAPVAITLPSGISGRHTLMVNMDLQDGDVMVKEITFEDNKIISVKD